MRKGWYSRGDNPPNYYRSGLSADDVRRAMEGSGWLSLTQVSAIVSDKISPEAKARYANMHATNGKVTATHHRALPLDVRIATGCRDLVRSKLTNLMAHGKVERDGKGKHCKYRWIETEDVAAEQAPS